MDATDRSEAIRDHYRRAVASASAVGYGPAPAETANEFQRRVAPLLDETAADALRRLTMAYEHARYGGVFQSDDDVARAHRDADALITRLLSLDRLATSEAPIVSDGATTAPPGAAALTDESVVPPQVEAPRSTAFQATALPPTIDRFAHQLAAENGAGSGIIQVSRRSNGIGTFRFTGFAITVDGRRAAMIRDGKTLELSVGAGNHVVQVTCRKHRSQVLELLVKPGSTRVVECGFDGGAKFAATGRRLTRNGYGTINYTERLSYVEAHILD